MKNILVLSAHLDDAAFSVGPLLAEWLPAARIVVATAFTKSVANPAAFALACQLDKGLAADVDYMKIRREEDRAWSEKLGVEVMHGPLPEAPHRGYHSAKALFGAILLGDELEMDLQAWLLGLIDSLSPAVILVPLGIGNHVDHQWMRKVAEATISSRHNLAYYKDQPYAVKSGDASDGPDVGPWRKTQVPLSQDSLARAHAAAEAYRTQIPFQFGGAEPMRRVLNCAWENHLTIFHTAETPAFSELFSNPILL